MKSANITLPSRRNAYRKRCSAFPVPFHTPCGYTLRHRTLDNGIYWLETSECRELLAVCFPIWNAELSAAAAMCGKILEWDRAAGVETATPYRFFPQNISCVPLYELMETRGKWDGTVINRPALMNAIWENAPVYAMSLNGQTPPGRSPKLSGEILPRSDGKRVIAMFPQEGTDFLLLQ